MTAGSVSGPGISSSSFRYRGGLKKWVPRNRRRKSAGSPADMAAMPRPEVLVLTIAVFLTAGRDPGEQLPLDLEVLDHRLEHPVRVRQLLPVLLEVAGADAREVLRQVERRRLHLAQGLEGRSGEVQERHVQPRAGEMGRDLRAHRPRAEHDDLADHAGAAAPWYMRSMRSLYFSSTTRRFTLSFGVSSPVSMENSFGRRAIFLIFSYWA